MGSLRAALTREEHHDLDDPAATAVSGGLVWFLRRLRFGLVMVDGSPDVRAFVLVDATPVGDDGVRPGLLLHGDPARVPAPCRPDDWTTRRAGRPAGGTGPLLAWLVEADRRYEADPSFDPEAGLGHPHAHPRHRGERVVQMYDLFARAGWLPEPGLRGVAQSALCHGIARVGFTAIRGDTAVVVASPLFVEPAAPVANGAIAAGGAHRRRRWLGRWRTQVA
ncbi:MAG TPA: hypothetical protein VFR97_08465 [Capillimicrobium sp.]|nr:hypothetical protein [Capillimicrobium sp.]